MKEQDEFSPVMPHRLPHLKATSTYRNVDGKFVLFSDRFNPLDKNKRKLLENQTIYIKTSNRIDMFEELQMSWSKSIKSTLKKGDVDETKEIINNMVKDTIFSDGEYIAPEQFDACRNTISTLISNSTEQTIRAVLSVSNKDYSTMAHSIRVMELGVSFGLYLKWPEAEILNFAMACLTHDLGKLEIPDEILKSDKRLTDEEFEIIKTHTKIGATIIGNLEIDDENAKQSMCDCARYHHEKIDGTGYYGLSGDNISKFCRILGIIDCHEALTSHDRVYRKALSLYDALVILKNDMQSNKYDRYWFGQYVTHFLNPLNEERR